jgi:hypothetical protein
MGSYDTDKQKAMMDEALNGHPEFLSEEDYHRHRFRPISGPSENGAILMECECGSQRVG